MKIIIQFTFGKGFGYTPFFLWLENNDKNFLIKFDFLNKVLINRKYLKERAV